jgi:[ribosomal protein S5]-alanine N-acetyltransferase
VDNFDAPVPAGKEPSSKKFEERVQRYRASGKARDIFVFGIFDRRSDAYLGQIDLFMLNSRLRWGNIGYHVQNLHYGQGYASEAAALALRAAFKQLDFHRIEAAMESKNRASKKVAINIGLKFEGVRKKFFPDDGGIDMAVYAANAVDHK